MNYLNKATTDHADKIIALWKQMDAVFGDKYSQAHLRLAIIAGLSDWRIMTGGKEPGEGVNKQ